MEVAGEKYECAVFDGMFFTLTKDGEVEIVVTAPRWEFAEVVASESYVDPKTGADVHAVDVHTDAMSLLLFVTVKEGRITEIVRGL